MSDTTLIPPPEEGKTRPTDVTEPSRNVEYATIPPDITVRPDRIVLKRNIFVVSTWTMVLASLIIFYIPFFNGLLGGALGGYHAGRMKRALAAAVVNSIAVPAVIWFFSFLDKQPGLHFLSGLTFGEWVALHVIGTFIGAVGGAASRPLITDRDLYRYT